MDHKKDGRNEVTKHWTRSSLASAALALTLALPAAGAENLVKDLNGGFELGLTNWLVHFPDHDFLKDNRLYVSVVEDGARKHVLKFILSRAAADNWGVQALGQPVRIDPKKRYKLTVAARTTGPSGRIYVMGKRWHPKAKRSETPTNAEVRDAFKGPIMSFAGEKGTAQFTNVKRVWATESVEIPPREMTELAYSFWTQCEFLEIHLVGIGGTAGEFFIDDVKLEESGPILPTQIKKDKSK
jgi:hypothetical protein